MPGRTTILNDNITAAVVSGIKNGLYPVQACIRCGVSHQTYYDWIAKGEQGIEPYFGFLEAVKKAEASLEYDVSSDVLKKTKRSKSAIPGFIFLSRRFKERWSEKITLEAPEETAVARIKAILSRFEVSIELPSDKVGCANPTEPTEHIARTIRKALPQQAGQPTTEPNASDI